MEPIVEEKLRRLRSLLVDYSYPEKRSSGMLREIDSLLSWALNKVIKIGFTATSVEETLGKPHILIGDESSPTSRWLYPSIPTEPEAARNPQWFYSLQFNDGVLQLIERLGWIV
jgi:hypothetical protein